jgi:hypothetical protein
MRCQVCGRSLKGNERTCPQCGGPPAEKLAGMLKTSTILISADNTEGVYRSVQDVPEPLRKRLRRATNSIHSRTILIADRRGRQEIARALKKLPGASKRRLTNSLLSGKAPTALPKLTIPQTVGILAAGTAGLLAWLMLTHNW